MSKFRAFFWWPPVVSRIFSPARIKQSRPDWPRLGLVLLIMELNFVWPRERATMEPVPASCYQSESSVAFNSSSPVAHSLPVSPSLSLARSFSPASFGLPLAPSLLLLLPPPRSSSLGGRQTHTSLDTLTDRLAHLALACGWLAYMIMNIDRASWLVIVHNKLPACLLRLPLRQLVVSQTTCSCLVVSLSNSRARRTNSQSSQSIRFPVAFSTVSTQNSTRQLDLAAQMRQPIQVTPPVSFN